MPAPVRPNNYYSENTPAENGGGASSEEKPAAKSILEKPAAPLDIRKRVNIFMTNPKSGGWGARCFILFDVLMIILSALNFFIETIDGIDMSAIRSIELVTNIFFSAEIAALTWAGTVDPKKMNCSTCFTGSTSNIPLRRPRRRLDRRRLVKTGRL